MDQLKNFLLGIFALLIYGGSFGQSKQEIKIYTIKDGSVILYLLPNNKFGYTSFNGVSPHTFIDKRNKGIKPGPALYEINEIGYGEYILKSNKLKLNFTNSINPIDSISNTFSNTSKFSDSLEINIVTKSYYSAKYLESELGIGTEIKTKDNTILLNTEFQNFGRFKIAKSQLPLNLMINENYELTIDKNSDQLIKIFVNPFKTTTTDKLRDKVIDFSILSDITNE